MDLDIHHCKVAAQEIYIIQLLGWGTVDKNIISSASKILRNTLGTLGN